MVGSIITGVLAVFGALALLWALLKILAMSGLTASLVFNLGFASAPPPVPPPPPAPTQQSAPAPPSPAAPATTGDAAIAAALSQLAQASREQSQAFTRQAEAFDRLSTHLDSRPASPPPCAGCDPDGRVRGVQRIRAR